jgi:hypothetical protein
VALLAASCAARPRPLAAPPPIPSAPVDSDHDGIPDERDLCPLEPEIQNGFQDEDGCPDHLKIPVIHDGAGMTPTYLFPKGDASRSLALLAALESWMSAISAEPPDELVCFAFAGPDEKNPLALARDRARAVAEILVKMGGKGWRTWICADLGVLDAQQPERARGAYCFMHHLAPAGCSPL